MPSFGDVFPNAVAPGTEEKSTTALGTIVAEGQKESGSIDKYSITDALTVLSAKHKFTWKAPADLLDEPVSNEYRQESLQEVFGNLLQDFNYVVITGDDGNIDRLLVTGRKLENSDSVAETQDRQLNVNVVNRETMEAFDKMTQEQREAFEIAGQALTPPPEILDQFEPFQTPASMTTGPLSPALTQNVPQPNFRASEEFSSLNQSNPDDQQIESFQPYISELGPPTSWREPLANELSD